MSLNKVIEEIKAQADAKKQEIITLAKKEADAIINEAKQKESMIDEAYYKETTLKINEYLNRELSALELELRRSQLNTRKEILKEIEEKLKQKISELAENEKLLSILIKRALKELPDAKYIYSNPKDRKIVEKLAPKLNYAGTIDCLGGIIVEDSKHEVRINYTYDLLVESVISKHMHEIYRRLFGE